MATEHGNVIVRFSDVTFGYDPEKPVLDAASFSVRENAKITIMGQNGAGKSTIFKLITGALKPQKGAVHITDGASVGIALQVVPREKLGLTIREYFSDVFTEKIYDLDKRVTDVLAVVHLIVPLDRLVKDLSGGQQARLLLAYALIQKPDVLLLDEPTNNLDAQGIGHLTEFLIMYEKTVIVISHDANFLNCFTHGVLNLDVHTHKVEQYVGNYTDVVEEIAARVERDRMANARLLKDIQDRKDKVNFFANKGGKMRKLASKLREEVAEAEENMVDVRQEDRTLGEFTIPAQEFPLPIVQMTSVSILKDHKPVEKEVSITLRRKQRLLVTGPNGIGKSTLLAALAEGRAEGAKIAPDVRVGYYRQDFSGLNFDDTVFESLKGVMIEGTDQDVYATAGHFLLHASLLKNKVSSLSEGQKGLLCYARFVLQ
ncbi:MAG TPA: ATP-binding cassette domain-containing protein, partial [Nitrospirota bacterium]